MFGENKKYQRLLEETDRRTKEKLEKASFEIENRVLQAQNKRLLDILESMSGEQHIVNVDDKRYPLRNPLYVVHDQGLSIKHADGEMFFAKGSYREVSNTNPRQGKPSFISNY